MKVAQDEGSAGSLKWLQRLVNDQPALLDAEVRRAVGLGEDVLIAWRSPLRGDSYSEYRDQTFLGQLEIELPHQSLESFWPSRGPQWDALAVTPTGAVLLVEAKAHIGELTSHCAARNPSSLERIQDAFDATKQHYGAPPAANWLSPYYQYTNRLAHLYLLREVNRLDAHLVHVCFLNDRQMGGPATDAEWKRALKDVHEALGLPDRPIPGLCHVMIDVERL